MWPAARSCGHCAAHEGGVLSAQFSADGKTVLTASCDKTARLWDVASGKELRVLRGHEDRVNSAQFSADGKTVLTASLDKTARLWDVASGKELRALRGHEDEVYQCAVFRRRQDGADRQPGQDRAAVGCGQRQGAAGPARACEGRSSARSFPPTARRC